ncbi:integral membrane transport protein [Streptomyces sp. TRM68367]|uniref:integral membrane transport protein n=1 Tax=Streptomyces sp. TRM68367 TaxID=2758415 RepID=UPI00165A35B6|nr:integral membrane transport protein [Streptomyces sp. TRM68367]MBC9728392.1 integral membrane transport protein [Streptomyces sp. TRM68367]
MSAVTDAVRVAPAADPVSQSIRDSMVVARRNLNRISRTPDPVRSYRPGFISPRVRDRRPNAWKGQVK